MSTSNEKAMRLALEALKNATIVDGMVDCWDAMDALKEALAKQSDSVEQRSVSEHVGEPVAWLDEYGNAFPLAAKQYSVVGKHWKPLYTTPPQGEARGLSQQQRPSRSDIKPLTDEQIEQTWEITGDYDSFARAIEAAHGIKE